MSILYVLFLGISFIFWELRISTPWIVFSGLAVVCKLIAGSLKEGEVYWEEIERPDLNTARYSTARLVFHTLVILGVITSAIMLSIESDRTTWNNGSLPVRWKWAFLTTAILYGASAIPSVMALSNEKLWKAREDQLQLLRYKRMLSISVVKEVITAGFLVPLIYGANDIVNDLDDSEWRAYAASLVFTNAVIYFVVFWYVTDWNVPNPLENNKIISRICRASGMFVVYVVIIRRLHVNKIITSMNLVSEKDNVALVGAFMLLFAGYAIRLKDFGLIHVPTLGIVSAVFLILFLLFISINI